MVFDIAVEANRPDAWCMAGVARDLAARLGLPFAIPATVDLVRAVAGGGEGANPRSGPPEGPPVDTLASVRVDDLDLCPRFTAG